MNCKDIPKEILDIIRRLAYPEHYAPDYNKWFSGDGPAEEYYDKLAIKAGEVMVKLGIPELPPTHSKPTVSHFWCENDQ